MLLLIREVSTMIETTTPTNPDHSEQEQQQRRRERNHRAAAMLRSWLAEEDNGDDERCWPFVEAALKEDRVNMGEPDESGA